MLQTSPPVTRLLALFLATAGLAGCAGGDGDEGTPAEAPPSGAHPVVGQFVMKVRPKLGTIAIARVAADAAGTPRIQPENLANLTIVADGVAGSGPANTVELDTISTVDTYNTVASGSCPANAFCADVQFSHFFSGLNLSAVYVQVTAITTSTGQTDTTHAVTNGIASTPFGLDVSKGAWQYTQIPATLAYGAATTQTWIFANPDDADYNVYLNAVAALRPTLWFKNGSVIQTAPLLGGQPATLHYEYARNGACRGTNWSMQGYFKGANIDVHTTSWPGAATDTYFDQDVVMPFGSGVSFWFNNTDNTGCNVYDSNGGNNYTYTVISSTPALHFAGPNAQFNPFYTNNWSYYADAGVKAGATITVDYELERNQCTQAALDRYGRVAAGTTLKMFYAFDGGSTFTGVDLLGLPYGMPSAINGSSGQVFVPPSITIPQGSHKMTAYFYGTGANNCANYDSNLGSNYTFNY